MHIWAFVRWWYGPGWVEEWRRFKERLSRVEDYFSIPVLIRTIFQPFRQIDAGAYRGGLEVQFRKAIDKLMSRFIGAGARLVLIIIGSIWWIISGMIGLVWLIIWPLLPLAPALGLALALLKVGSL